MVRMTLYPAKLISGLLAGLLSVFVRNLLPLFVTVTIFEAVDFVTGVIKSYVVAKRTNQRFAFESVKAWRTIYKYVFILVGVFLAELLDKTLATEIRLRLANYFMAFCCGVEFWSFLENASQLSESPMFVWLKQYVRRRIRKEVEGE